MRRVAVSVLIAVVLSAVWTAGAAAAVRPLETTCGSDTIFINYNIIDYPGAPWLWGYVTLRADACWNSSTAYPNGSNEPVVVNEGWDRTTTQGGTGNFKESDGTTMDFYDGFLTSDWPCSYQVVSNITVTKDGVWGVRNDTYPSGGGFCGIAVTWWQE